MFLWKNHPQHLLFLNLLVWNIYLDQDHSVIYQAYLECFFITLRISLRKNHRVRWWIPLGCSTGEVLGDQTKWHMRSVFVATLSCQLQMRDFGHPFKIHHLWLLPKKKAFQNLPICFWESPPQKTGGFCCGNPGKIAGDFPGSSQEIDELKWLNKNLISTGPTVAEKRY